MNKREPNGKDEKQLPPTIQMAKNFVKAVYRHVKDGLAKTEVEDYVERIETCNKCEMRAGNRCTHPSCGCFIDKKAWWASEDCPLGKWPKLL